MRSVEDRALKAVVSPSIGRRFNVPRNWCTCMLPAALLAVTSLASAAPSVAVTQGSQSAPETTATASRACPSAELIPVSALDFGRIAIRDGAKGWLLLDQGGTHSSAGQMQMAGRTVPSAARLLLRAAPGDSVWLETQVEQPEWVAGEGTAYLSNVQLGASRRVLVEEGNAWLVRMPDQVRGDTGMAEIELTVTATVRVAGHMKTGRAAWRIIVTCVRQKRL